MDSERSTVADVMAGGSGGDDLRLNYVELSHTMPDVSTGGARVSWSKETWDRGGVHDSGKGAIRAAFNCVMHGTVQISTNDPVRVDIERQNEGGSSVVTSADVEAGGWSVVPFEGQWSADDLLYVKVSAKEGTADVGNVLLKLTQLERPAGS